MELKVVTDSDKEFVMSIDKYIDDTGYSNRVYTKSGYVIWEENQRVGIMAHCILWDNLPFLNLIHFNYYLHLYICLFLYFLRDLFIFSHVYKGSFNVLVLCFSSIAFLRTYCSRIVRL